MFELFVYFFLLEVVNCDGDFSWGIFCKLVDKFQRRYYWYGGCLYDGYLILFIVLGIIFCMKLRVFFGQILIFLMGENWFMFVFFVNELNVECFDCEGLKMWQQCLLDGVSQLINVMLFRVSVK